MLAGSFGEAKGFRRGVVGATPWLSVVELDVLAPDLSNEPGVLAEKLSRARVNIEYAYETAGGAKGRAQLIFKVNNIDRACRLLGGR